MGHIIQEHHYQRAGAWYVEETDEEGLVRLQWAERDVVLDQPKSRWHARYLNAIYDVQTGDETLMATKAEAMKWEAQKVWRIQKDKAPKGACNISRNVPLMVPPLTQEVGRPNLLVTHDWTPQIAKWSWEVRIRSTEKSDAHIHIKDMIGTDGEYPSDGTNLHKYKPDEVNLQVTGIRPLWESAVWIMEKQLQMTIRSGNP